MKQNSCQQLSSASNWLVALDKALPLPPSFSPSVRCMSGLLASAGWSRFGAPATGKSTGPLSGLPLVGAIEQTLGPLPSRTDCLHFPSLTDDACGSETAQDYESCWHNSIPSAILKVFPGPLALSHVHTVSLQFCHHSQLPSKQLTLYGKCWSL